ncbi:MAG: hypothetical protein FJX02_01825 [Alphaproteobacteria bacterium]|nr:hypothetical protein [Alphaproteobacteria bacterium]
MTERGSAETPAIGWMLVDSVALWLRNQAAFWAAAFVVAVLTVSIEFVLAWDNRFHGLREHWGWDLLFSLVYAFFLDRWMRIALLEDASPCDEVDALRAALIRPRFLAVAGGMVVVALGLSFAPHFYVYDWLKDIGAAESVAYVLGSVLPWLPHLVIWSMALAFIALLLPAASAGARMSIDEAWDTGKPARPGLFAMILVLALLSLTMLTLCAWGVQHLPRKPWAPSLLAGASRLFDCVLLALGGGVLAQVFRQLADWEPPEPDDRPYRGMRPRKS